ncbi:bifunctional glutamate N-acetyltransferase/amino-acid acetyltransferase ArgJ [Salinithrix halophila]|uniref:Arginine biosynthesis bifunctional protein ArgJ n=1 Tax=Salinithrix halophila TaxID=1485204 RepID=A0ABV8JG18_9BACL
METIQLTESRETTAGFTTVSEPRITSPLGFTAAGMHAGIKRKRKDLGLIRCEVPAAAAAVYTMNAFQAAPLTVTREGMAVESRMQALLVNSGNANACTGDEGLADAYRMRKAAAHALDVPEHLIGVASTGVIGERLPIGKIIGAVPGLASSLAVVGHEDFCRSILTTDTGIKAAEVRLHVEGREVRISGVAKGSGMVHPNMATMLAFMTTDAVIEPAPLHGLLREVTDESYNMITVDGDSSTNDMVTAMASGLAGHRPLTENHPDWAAFREAFAFVSRELAKMIARDGEGATRLVEVRVTGATTLEGARQAAKAVVGSSLVKTAVYGADPNWGRILCAVGYSGAQLDPAGVTVELGGVTVVEGGRPAIFDEGAARRALEQPTVEIGVHLHEGVEQACAWGCDLTYDYVRINASYRT